MPQSACGGQDGVKVLKSLDALQPLLFHTRRRKTNRAAIGDKTERRARNKTWKEAFKRSFTTERSISVSDWTDALRLAFERADKTVYPMSSLLNWGTRFRMLVGGVAHLILFAFPLSSSVHPSIRPPIHRLYSPPAEKDQLTQRTCTTWHTLSHTLFVIEKDQQGLCVDVLQPGRSEAKKQQWFVDLEVGYHICLVFIKRSKASPRRSRSFRKSSVMESLIPLQPLMPLLKLLASLNVFCREDTVMTQTPDQCVICWFWQWMNIEYRCSCFLGHIWGTRHSPDLIWKRELKTKWDVWSSEDLKKKKKDLQGTWTVSFHYRWKANLCHSLCMKLAVSEQRPLFYLSQINTIYICYWGAFHKQSEHCNNHYFPYKLKWNEWAFSLSYVQRWGLLEGEWSSSAFTNVEFPLN